MSYRRRLGNLVSQIGKESVERIVAILDDEARRADEPWKRTVLDLIAESLRRNGSDGLAIARMAIEDILEGKPVVALRKATKSVLVASNLLAQLQKAEAQKRNRVRQWIAYLVQLIAQFLRKVI